MAGIKGLEGMSTQELNTELERGGRFVIFTFTISILVMTFKQPTDIYFLRGNQSGFVHGLPFTMLSLVLGWWGIPWGPIYTIWSTVENSAGGKDVTREVLQSMNNYQAQQMAR